MLSSTPASNDRTAIRARRGLALVRMLVGAMFVWVFFENYGKGLYTPGGYASLINVYATVKNGPSNAKLKQPIAKLVLSKVRVIDVKAPAPGAETNTTFLLALSAKNAEQVIFLARYESLWFTLVKPNAKPAKTTGRGYDNLL